VSKMITLKYYFSVEGETEKWYFDWLQEKINNETTAKYKVSIISKIQKNPLKIVKSMTALSKVEITHVLDYESNDDVHTAQFITTLDQLKKATKLGKQVKYNLGYSNFTFELWVVLHKTECNAIYAHRRQYLNPINQVYNENFEDLKQYKHEDNFKRILGKISISEVKCAIERAKLIMHRNKENGLVLQQYKGYRYYKENPSLSIWQSVEKILKDCKLL